MTSRRPRRVVDTTELTIGSRKGYLAAVLDLYARRLVGWALHPTNDRDLTIAALHQALAQRQPGIGLVHHSDRGCTYTCADYRAMLDVHNVTASMSGTGNCYDNAVMESWFATLKAELGDTFTSHDVADAALSSCIDIPAPPIPAPCSSSTFAHIAPDARGARPLTPARLAASESVPTPREAPPSSHRRYRRVIEPLPRRAVAQRAAR